MQMPGKIRMLAVSLVACIGLLAGAVHADSFHMAGGYTVDLIANDTFYTEHRIHDYYTFDYWNTSGYTMYADSSRSDALSLYLTADPGLRFTNIYAFTHGVGVTDWRGGYLQADQTLYLPGRYGPVTQFWSFPYPGYGTGWDFSWLAIPVNAPGFTLDFSEYLRVLAYESHLTPGGLKVIAQLEEAPVVPLPGAVLLFASGLLGLAGWRRFRKG